MDTGIIAAFIASGFAVFTSIINIIVSTVNVRRSSNIHVIVETRISYMEKLRNANAVFIGITNPKLILRFGKTNKEFYQYIKDIVESAGILKTLLKSFYPIEFRMVKLINSIEKDCIELIDNETNNDIIEKINNELKEYILLFNQYDWVYWQYIIKQADGKLRDSNIDFDKIYEESKNKYKNEYNYDWI
jgi:hypothetical protein